MSAPRRGDRDLIKALNRNLVLNIVRRHGPLSRTQIRDLSQLSMGAVSQITAELLDEGWVQEVGESEPTGGRRQILLHLKPQAGYAVGVKLMEDRIVCAVTDLEVSEVLYLEQPTHGHSPEAVVSAIVSAVRQAIVDAGIPPARCWASESGWRASWICSPVLCITHRFSSGASCR